MKWQQRPIKKPKSPRNNLTAEFVRSILDYDPETGVLTWKCREGMRPGWNGRYAGKEAGSFNSKGYQQISINGSRYSMHRLAWLIQTGEWPQHQIDHEDGDVFNNRFSNLREATQQENTWNRKTDIRNTSGVKGVSWDKQNQKWQVLITVDRKRIHLGRFDSFEDAVAVRQDAELEHFGDFRRK
jgi:hypothetical protein